MSINKKQTAVDFLMDKLFDSSMMVDEQIKWFEEAKEMEKKQIIRAFDEGQEYEYQYHVNIALNVYSETYYNEKYGGDK
jgi:GTP1/Obg family GTP-binding protein